MLHSTCWQILLQDWRWLIPRLDQVLWIEMRHEEHVQPLHSEISFKTQICSNGRFGLGCLLHWKIWEPYPLQWKIILMEQYWGWKTCSTYIFSDAQLNLSTEDYPTNPGLSWIWQDTHRGQVTIGICWDILKQTVSSWNFYACGINCKGSELPDVLGFFPSSSSCFLTPPPTATDKYRQWVN